MLFPNERVNVGHGLFDISMGVLKEKFTRILYFLKRTESKYAIIFQLTGELDKRPFSVFSASYTVETLTLPNKILSMRRLASKISIWAITASLKEKTDVPVS